MTENKTINLSGFPKEKLKKIAQILLEKVSQKADWMWSAEYRGDYCEEGDFLLKGESKKFDLTIHVYPWISTPINEPYLTLLTKGREYNCLFYNWLKDTFVELNNEFQKILEKTRDKQFDEEQKKEMEEKQRKKKEYSQQAEELIKSLLD